MITVYRLVLSAVFSVIVWGLLHFFNNPINKTPSLDPVILLVVFVFLALTALISPSLAHIPVPRFARPEQRERGQVKWFNVSKGYGFVTRESGEDVFVHFRSIRGKGRRMLHEGQRVEFTVVEGDKGPQAEDVAPLE